jgi:hypothetical protein
MPFYNELIDMTDVLDESPQVIARTYHFEHTSILHSVLYRSKVPICLLQNGVLETEKVDPLHKTSNNSNNVKKANIRYYFPTERYRTVYRFSNLFSLLAALSFFVQIIAWADMVAYGSLGLEEDEFLNHSIYFTPLFVYILFDLLRGRLGTQERIELTFGTTDIRTIKGELPLENTHNFSSILIVLGILFAAIILIPESDLLVLALGAICYLFLGFILIASITSYFSSREDNNQQKYQSLVQFYFALMNMKEDTFSSTDEDNHDAISELNEIKIRLEQFEELLSQFDAAKEIFQSKSPSLIAIAIGATTEKLMRTACDQLGIKRKSSARPTLLSFTQEYQTKRELDDKIRTHLNLIREYRNRAAHHFNLDWKESLIVLDLFCQFVEWFSITHPVE